jgi:hypothetical protein
MTVLLRKRAELQCLAIKNTTRHYGQHSFAQRCYCWERTTKLSSAAEHHHLHQVCLYHPWTSAHRLIRPQLPRLLSQRQRVLWFQTLLSFVKLSSRTHQAHHCIQLSNHWPQMGQSHKQSHILLILLSPTYQTYSSRPVLPHPWRLYKRPLQRSRQQSPLCLKRSRYRLVLFHRGCWQLLGRWDNGGRALAQVVSPIVLCPIVRLTFLSPKVGKLVHNVSLLRLTDVS